ncbi:MAG TPA: NAD(+) synthase [Polyangiaceae bacterium]
MQHDPFSNFDPAAEVERISRFIRSRLSGDLRRRGAVVGISGGVDSSVCAALCVAALGAERVFGVLMPERESSAQSLELGRAVSEQLGVGYRVQDITTTLEALECYATRDSAIAELIPGYGAGWKQKVVIMGGLSGRFNHFKLVAKDPSGQVHEARLLLGQYLSIVAATNYKQRVRKSIEYFHADRLNYAVIGTPNRLEYDQGFFVKNGDGSADLKPIAHLYKTEVYALARWLGLPRAVCDSTPTTDTYTLPQGQDEFFFALPYQQMDQALWAHDHGVPPALTATRMGLAPELVKNAYRDIEAKRRSAHYLHAPPLMLQDGADAAQGPAAARAPA